MGGLFNFMSKNKIAIYYEHPEWFRPLFAELDRRGAQYDKMDAASHFFDPGAPEDYAIVFNRMSASAYLRGHSNAIFYTAGLLAHLERGGTRVINGFDAFQIEASKAQQLALLRQLGIAFPKTRILNSLSQVAEAVDGLTFPIIFKPNIGGRGAGIVKFDTRDELLSASEIGALDLGIDSTALLQEFVPKRGGHINRAETLSGKVLYAVRIYPKGEDFNLCPAEICDIQRQAAADLCVVEAVKQGLRIERFEPEPEIVEKVERIAAAAKLDVGGVEYMIDDRTGEALFYDINALSNFVADTSLVGFDPHERLVDFILEELERCDTDTGCRSSAAG
jgi:glutathione synthase/RimK-type ligase-like ATP-grasp enzyme